MYLRHPESTLFPYTTLFRSLAFQLPRGARYIPRMTSAEIRRKFLAFFAARGHREVPSSPLVPRSEEHTSELQSRRDLVCRLLLEKKNTTIGFAITHLHSRGL